TAAILQSLVIMLLAWLIVFTAAWVVPYAWKLVGVAAGAGWGLTAVLSGLVNQGEAAGALTSLLTAAATPFIVAAGPLGIAVPGAAFYLLSLAMGVVLGLLFAWTGYAFRLFQ